MDRPTRVSRPTCSALTGLALAVVLAASSAACNRPSSNGGPAGGQATEGPATSASETFVPGTWVDRSATDVTVTDASGVSHPRVPIQRIVSVAPNVTEILFALGAGDRVVGVTTNCNYPPEAAAKEMVGDFNLNFEKILSLHPDLVIGTNASTDGARTVLQKAGVPYFAVSKRSLSEIVESMHALGVLLGQEREAAAVTARWNEVAREVRDRAPAEDRTTVLWVQWYDPLSTVGPGNFHHDLIELAGAENVAKDLGAAYGPFSEEVATLREPDVILVPSPEVAAWVDERFRGTRAVTSGRVYEFSSDESARAGPRVIEALAELAELIYPSRPSYAP